MLSKILILAMLSTAMATAQRGGGGGGASAETATGEGMWGATHAPRQSTFDWFATKLKLDKDQRAAVEPIVDTARESMGPAQKKIIDSRKQLALALLDSKSSPDAVAQLTAAYTAAAAQAKTVEATAFGKICALLKPNQLSKAAPTFAIMAQLVEQGQMGGGPGGHWGGDRGGPR